MRTALLALALVVPVKGIAQEAPPPAPAAQIAPAPVPDGWQLISGDSWSYSVPGDWIEIVPAPSPTKTAWRSQDMSLGFYTNVNLVIEGYVGDHKSYQAWSWKSLQTVGMPIAQTRARIGQRPAFEIETSWPTGAAIPYRTLQRGTAGNGLGYVMTCSGSESAVRVVWPVCTMILDSLRLP